MFIEDFLISFSLDSSFNFKDDKDWIVYVDTLHISETSGKLFMQPSISLSGSIDCYGAMFDNIMYRDTYSTLTGYSSLEWNYNDSILDSASIAMALTDNRNREDIVIDLSVSNPFGYSFDHDEFLDNFYATGTIQINSLSSSHFLDRQDNSNAVSTNVSLLGPVSQMYISADFPTSSIRLNGSDMEFTGKIEFENNIISCSNEIGIAHV